MIPEELELRLLSSIRDGEDALVCRDRGLSKASFVVEEHGVAYEYIEGHARANDGAIPSREDVQALCEIVLGEPGDLMGYIRRVRDEEIGRDAGQILLRESAKLAEDPGGAVTRIVSELSDLRLTSRGKVAYLDRDAEARIKRFDDARTAIAEGGVLGLPTGLKTFDLEGLGWQRGEFIVVMGVLSVGKSWLIMKFCVEMYNSSGVRVLFVSPEMSTEEQSIRFDTLLSAAKGEALKATEILKGEEDRRKYQAWLAEVAKRSDFISKDCSEETGVLTFEDIWDWTQEYRPDVVAVDGLHLLGSRNNPKQSGWEILKNGCVMLKNLAQQAGIVVLAAHQPDRSAVKNVFVPPRLDQTGYGMGVSQSADVVLSMALAKDAQLERVFTVPKVRNRPPVVDLRFMKWDVNSGIIVDLTDARKDDI